MAKQRKDGIGGEHLSYCAGKGFVGDGTKEASPCPFRDSRVVFASRYVCGHCSTGTKPSDIIADANGITESGRQILSAMPANSAPSTVGRRRRMGREDLPDLEPDMIDGKRIDEVQEKTAPEKTVNQKRAAAAAEVEAASEAEEAAEALASAAEEADEDEEAICADGEHCGEEDAVTTDDSATNDGDPKPAKKRKTTGKKKRRLGRRRLPSGAE